MEHGSSLSISLFWNVNFDDLMPRFSLIVLESLILQAIPGMLLALVLCFDHRRNRDMGGSVDTPSKGHKYVWYALFGYAVGLVTALAAGILYQSAQPALLYLVSFIVIGFKYLDV